MTKPRVCRLRRQPSFACAAIALLVLGVGATTAAFSVRRGVRIATAGAAVDTVARNLAAEHPGSYRTGPVRLSLAPIEAEVVSGARPALVAAAGAVALALIIACANVREASADTRFALFVIGVLAVLAVVLAAVGVYAVVAYAMARRRREMAVRLALGASRKRLVALVHGESLIWTFAGPAAGLAGAAVPALRASITCSPSAANSLLQSPPKSCR